MPGVPTLVALPDTQYLASARAPIFEARPDRIDVWTYSPHLKTYKRDDDHTFSLPRS
ncbi:MAG: hypothetical protein AAGC55_06075 [Myxococcota bacterium]